MRTIVVDSPEYGVPVAEPQGWGRYLAKRED